MPLYPLNTRDARGQTAQHDAARYGRCPEGYRYRLVTREAEPTCVEGCAYVFCCACRCLLLLAGNSGGFVAGGMPTRHEMHWKCEPIPPDERLPAAVPLAQPASQTMQRDARKSVLPTAVPLAQPIPPPPPQPTPQSLQRGAAFHAPLGRKRCLRNHRLREVTSESQKSCSRCINGGKRWPTVCCPCACCVDLACCPLHYLISWCCLENDLVCEPLPRTSLGQASA